jgi:hypothetical protein
VSSTASTVSIRAIRRRSSAAKLNVVGLVLTAAGMLLQIIAGSTLYPSVTGPVVLLVTAAIVAFVPGRWPPYVGLAVPTVLGIGALVAASMTGGFIDQLTDVGTSGLFLGSVTHVVGLIAAVAGGVGMLMGPRVVAERGR